MHHVQVVFLALTLVFAAAPSARAQESTTRPATSDRFGINAHLRHDPGGAELMSVISAGGFGAFRDGEQWNTIERQKGVFQVDPITDQMIDQAVKQGVEPLVPLVYGNPIYDNHLDPDHFADFAIWMMDRYKGRIKYWEIWNEPNNFFFAKTYGGAWNGKEKDGSESPWVSKFADFVTSAAAKIKKAHPEVKLMTGTTGPVDLRLLRDHPAMWKDIDILSIHPYPYRLPPELQPYGGDKLFNRDGVTLAGPDHSFQSEILAYRAALVALGRPDMPIWITEVGYSTFVPHKPEKLWSGMTESAQAMYESRFGILAASLGVEKTFFYCLMNTGENESEVENRFGIIRRDRSVKPAFAALQRLSGLMPGDTRPLSLQIEVKRLAPQTRTDTDAWDGESIKLLDEPQLHSFKRPDGKVVVFLWRAGRIYGDFQEELCNVQLHLKSAAVSHLVSAGRVVSGETFKPKTSVNDDALSVSDMPFGSDPLYLLFE